MISIDTEPGSEYSVRSAAGCTVATPAGQVICRVMPGILGSFCASTYVTCLSDAAATVTLVSSGAPGGTGGNTLTISQALAAANRAESAADRAEAGASAAELQAQGATVANSAAQAALAGAQAAETNAEASAQAAATSEGNATAAAQASATSEANAAEAANAAAAAAALAEESAWPAVMVLLRDELLQLVGEGHFDLDRDGEKIVVHTDRLGDPELAAVNEMLARFVPSFLELVQYNHHIEVSWRDVNKYAECTTIAEIQAVNSNYKNDVPSDGVWYYPLTSFTGSDTQWEKGLFTGSEKIKRIKLELPNATQLRFMFYFAEVEEVDIVANGKISNVTHMLVGSKCKKFSIVAKSCVDGGFSNNNAAVKYLEDAYIDMPVVQYFSLAYAKLNKKSVLQIAESLPAGTYDTKLGIHVDHQTDEEVIAAIQLLETKGRMLAVQWTGTPTAQTASTFGMRQVIYAKVGEIERPDGTTERVLDWGHYVTDETGYETFRSLESAYEYFGLPMPEEDLAATE